MKENRKSNFELLRIILIIMVLILHYIGIGGVRDNSSGITLYILNFAEAAFRPSVNVFVIITGYFMISKNSIKLSKIIQLIYITVFYGVIIYFIVIATKLYDLNIESLKIFIKSITDSWFITTYIILYLLIPFINKLVKILSKKNFEILLLVITFFFSIWPSIWTSITVDDGGYGIINFIFMYLIGTYIKLYKDDIKGIKKFIFIYVITTIITTIVGQFAVRAFNYNFIINIIGAIALFEIFKNINIKNNKIINKLASYTFAVYIIHTNPFILSDLFKLVFKTENFANSILLPIHLVLTTLCIYMGCVIIETIRKLIMKKIDEKIEGIIFKIEC